MGAPKEAPLITEEQYLALERKADEKHEYLDGEIIAMAGEKRPHGLISSNIVIAIGSQLLDKPCETYTKDTRVRSGPPRPPKQSTKGLYSYPDVVVICGGTEYLDGEDDVVINPTLIVEVLSPSTENFDRGPKADRYMEWNKSLKEYLLVWQSEPHVEHFRREADGTWVLRRHKGLEATADLKSIGCALSLRAAYKNVTFVKSPRRRRPESR